MIRAQPDPSLKEFAGDGKGERRAKSAQTDEAAGKPAASEIISFEEALRGLAGPARAAPWSAAPNESWRATSSPAGAGSLLDRRIILRGSRQIQSSRPPRGGIGLPRDASGKHHGRRHAQRNRKLTHHFASVVWVPLPAGRAQGGYAMIRRIDTPPRRAAFTKRLRWPHRGPTTSRRRSCRHGRGRL